MDLLSYAMGKAAGGGGKELEPLGNPASAGDILDGCQAYDENGDLITGTYEPIELEPLGNPASAGDILDGLEAYDENGILITGTYEPPITGDYIWAALTAESLSDMPTGSYDGVTGTLFQLIGIAARMKNTAGANTVTGRLFVTASLQGSTYHAAIPICIFNYDLTSGAVTSADFNGGASDSTSAVTIRGEIDATGVAVTELLMIQNGVVTDLTQYAAAILSDMTWELCVGTEPMD